MPARRPPHEAHVSAATAATGRSRSAGAGPLPLILCYHAVSDADWGANLRVTRPQLAEHLGLLAARGYVGLTFAECERRRQAGTLPSRTVVVTFDDGYRSNLTHALPILRDVGF